MSDLILQTNPLTMSHFEIARLAEKRSDNVKRVIETLSNQGVIELPQFEEVDNMEGNRSVKRNAYMINKRDSYVVMAQVNPAFTGRLVDRWMELEEMKSPKLPQTFSEALRLAADQAEKLELQRPAVEFVERAAELQNALQHYASATEVGAKIGLSAKVLNSHLENLNVYNRTTKRRTFKMWFVREGYGVLKMVEGGFTQCKFTPDGEVWITNRLTEIGVIE